MSRLGCGYLITCLPWWRGGAPLRRGSRQQDGSTWWFSHHWTAWQQSPPSRQACHKQKWCKTEIHCLLCVEGHGVLVIGAKATELWARSRTRGHQPIVNLGFASCLSASGASNFLWGKNGGRLGVGFGAHEVLLGLSCGVTSWGLSSSLSSLSPVGGPQKLFFLITSPPKKWNSEHHSHFSSSFLLLFPP